jgi:hypothetical protein
VSRGRIGKNTASCIPYRVVDLRRLSGPSIEMSVDVPSRSIRYMSWWNLSRVISARSSFGAGELSRIVIVSALSNAACTRATL